MEVPLLSGRAPAGPNLLGTYRAWVRSLTSHLSLRVGPCDIVCEYTSLLISLTLVAGAKKDEKTFVGARVIFFVIGGMTYSEVRSAYELTKSNNREVGLHIHSLHFD